MVNVKMNVKLGNILTQELKFVLLVMDVMTVLGQMRLIAEAALRESIMIVDHVFQNVHLVNLPINLPVIVKLVMEVALTGVIERLITA